MIYQMNKCVFSKVQHYMTIFTCFLHRSTLHTFPFWRDKAVACGSLAKASLTNLLCFYVYKTNDIQILSIQVCRIFYNFHWLEAILFTTLIECICYSCLFILDKYITKSTIWSFNFLHFSSKYFEENEENWKIRSSIS